MSSASAGPNEGRDPSYGYRIVLGSHSTSLDFSAVLNRRPASEITSDRGVFSGQ